MVWPVAFPLEAFLTRAGITALGTAATSEGIKSLQNQGMVNPGVAKEAFMRTLMGPTTEILNRTTDTPSGKVFAPTGEVIESNQIPGMAPAEQPQGIPGLLPPQQEKQVEGMSQASPPTKDKGFTMPATEDMSTLYNVENDDPLNVENIQNKIKYKKSKEDKNITEAYLGDKKVGELEKMTELPKMNGMYDYQVYLTNEQGETDFDNMDVQLGFNSAKDMMATGLWNKMKAEAPAAPVKFEYPSEEVRNQELNLAKEIFNISDTGASLEQYEKFKNNPIIQNQIERSKKAYNNTSAVEGYGTADYWDKRKFAGDTIGWKQYLKKYYGEGAPVKNREMFIVMGPSSAGKSSSVVDRLLKETGSILADSDEVKKTIAEFENGYNASGVHKESSDINARIMKLAASRGDNIVYPTTGREPAKLNALIERAEKFGYTPKVYYVTADRPVLLMRNLGRMLSTNRMVDADTLLTDEVLKDIKTNYEKLPDKYKAGIYDTTPKK